MNLKYLNNFHHDIILTFKYLFLMYETLNKIYITNKKQYIHK